MKTVDFFAGCGGLSLGLHNAGFDLELASDYKPYTQETFINNFKKGEFILKDILEIESNRWREFHKLKHKLSLVAGGPPCQGFSMANRQRLSDDPRNNLYKSFLSAVSFLQPKCILMENVPGILKSKLNILNEFSDIGYDGDCYVLNAKDFSIPQNRKRAFFILFKSTLKINTDLTSKFEDEKCKSRVFNLKDALFGLKKVEAKRERNRTDLESTKYGFRRENISEYHENDYLKIINRGKNISTIYNHLTRYNNDRDIEIFKLLPQGENSLHSSIKHLMPYSNRNHIFKDKYFKLEEDKPCKTITAHMSYDCNMYIHPHQARGLTPREAARVQTFSDNFEFKGPYSKWYEQIGNAVPPLLAEKIGRIIQSCF